MEPSCVSYNIKVISGSSSVTKCELNNSTHNEHPHDLKTSANYIYQGSLVRNDFNQQHIEREKFPLLENVSKDRITFSNSGQS